MDVFKSLHDAGVCDLRLMEGVGIEKFSEWCFNTANKFVAGITNNRCQCVKAEVFEHEDNSAIYVPEEEKYAPVTKEAFTQENPENCEVDFSGNLKVDVEKPVSVEKKKPNDLTQPPFKKPTDKKKEQIPLWPKKTTNTWIDKDSTWGF